MLELKRKTAIVTGAASGIGLGIAKALAGAGMNLVMADLQPDRLAAARRDIESMGPERSTWWSMCPTQRRSRPRRGRPNRRSASCMSR